MDGSGDLTTRFAAILASVAECDALHTQDGMGAIVGLGQCVKH